MTERSAAQEMDTVHFNDGDLKVPVVRSRRFADVRPSGVKTWTYR